MNSANPRSTNRAQSSNIRHRTSSTEAIEEKPAKEQSAGFPSGKSWFSIFASISIAMLVIVAYSNATQAVFVFDGQAVLLGDKSIYQLWPPEYLWSNTRPVAYTTFAINYAIGADDPFGYQIVNVLIHIINSILLYRLVGEIIRRSPGMPPDLQRDSFQISLLISLIWALHPLQTQAVTYIYQRQESLATIWYLTALIGAVSTITTRRWIPACLTVLSLILGLASKELVVTAPLMILWLDRAFFFQHIPGVVPITVEVSSRVLVDPCHVVSHHVVPSGGVCESRGWENKPWHFLGVCTHSTRSHS